MPKEYLNQNIILGIRPENILEAQGTEDHSFIFNVEMLDALGSDMLVHGHIGNDKQLITARLPGKWELAQRKQLNLTVRPNSLHLFDIHTKQRIQSS